MTDSLIPLLIKENIGANARVESVCEAIRARHPDRVLAFLYYGSSLRDLDDPEKMLDFYVLVDSYRKTHKNPIRVVLNAIIPPAVYYYEQVEPDGALSTCKYSIVSLKAFEARCSKRALLSVMWGRFSQPCVLLFPQDDAIASQVMTARETAVRHMASQTVPLVVSPLTATQFWARGFRESYQTELRPEASDSRSEDIVARYEDRYERLMTALYGPPQNNGLYTLPSASKLTRFKCQTLWALRRIVGKPAAAIRILNTAFTFDGGLDYVLRKLENHSGVTIKPTPSQQRHPVLWSPVLAWKLWRKGAFR